MATKRTTKSEKTTKTVKKAVTKAASRPRKLKVSEDEIRNRAAEIYRERIAQGIHRAAEDDWHQAEQELSSKK